MAFLNSIAIPQRPTLAFGLMLTITLGIGRDALYRMILIQERSNTIFHANGVELAQAVKMCFAINQVNIAIRKPIILTDVVEPRSLAKGSAKSRAIYNEAEQ